MCFSSYKTALRLFNSVNVNKYSYQNFSFKVQPRNMMGCISIKTDMYQIYSSFLAAKELGKQLEAWLSAADLTHGPARAIIAP